MRRALWLFLLIGVVLNLLQCSRQSELLHRTNPAWLSPPSKEASLGVVALDRESFIISDRDLFVADLKIYPEEIHPRLLHWSNQYLQEWSSKLENPSLSALLPDPALAHYPPPEPKRIRNTLYIQVRWPWPGEVIVDTTGALASLLLIPHELTIGVDLDPIQLYDYQFANRYVETEGETPQQLTALLTWSLWDNQLQQYRSYGVSSAALPLERPITQSALDRLYSELLLKLEQQTGLSRGKGP